MAHFMGVGGAAKLISNAEDNPQANAAGMFPNAAAANLSIFYDRAGSARTVSQVYSVLDARYASAFSSKDTRTAFAAAGGAPQAVNVASAVPTPALSIDNAAYLSSFPDSRSVTPVTATSQSGTDAASAEAPAFRSLFQAGDRTQPISPTVQELWGNSSSLTSAASATPEVRPPGRLDLFSDRNGTFSS
jgi:hypothetical protein